MRGKIGLGDTTQGRQQSFSYWELLSNYQYVGTLTGANRTRISIRKNCFTTGSQWLHPYFFYAQFYRCSILRQISKNNKKDVQGLRGTEEAYFDSQDGKGEFAPENREAWVDGRVEDTLENAEGFIDDKTGEITIITENITGDSATVATDRLVEGIFHETVGHHGLKSTLGDGLQLFLSRFRKTEGNCEERGGSFPAKRETGGKPGPSPGPWIKAR